MVDDRDIKIYVRGRGAENGEFEALREDIARHETNGNALRARRLGEKFAEITPEETELKFNLSSFSSSELYQMRVLMTFTAEYAIQKTVKNEYLADLVIKSVYDSLKANSKGFYDNISDGGAFTFYLLALNKSGETARNIGKQFAMLCGMRSEEVAEFGASVFTRCYEFFSQMTRDAGFVD